jgi:hypothetical protein
LSKEYGWTPTQVGQLTVAQVYVYYAELEDVGAEKKTDSAGAVIEMARGEAKRKAKWIDAMRESLRWLTKT